MPPARRVARVLANRSIPRRTRVDLARVEIRRRVARRAAYSISYPSAELFLTHDDFEVDWETLKSVLADLVYATDYRDAVVLDVGAHKGYFGAYALAHGARRVVSYEPETANASFVRRSIATAFAEDAWTVELAAVGSVAGSAELHVMEGSWGHALEPPEAWNEFEVETREVPIVAFADAFERALRGAGESRVIVKANIEGAECDLVLGTPVEVWAGIDEVVVATHPWAPCTEAELVAHLAAAGLNPQPTVHPRMLRLRR